jgi:mono/diheme cytochrome c family protein
VIDLLDTATLQLDVNRDAARASISRASSLLRGQMSRRLSFLKGSTTARTGQTPAQFAMPAFAWRLDDQEIADVLTFVRSGCGNKAPAVDKAAIAKLRADPH